MKKKRVIILLSIFAAVIVFGCFTYLYFTAAAEKEFFYENYIDNEDADAVNQRLNMLPEQIELEIDPKPGYIAHFQDYSLTIAGYEDVEAAKDSNNNLYFIGNNKVIANMNVLKSDLINDPILSSKINRAVGRKINNDYDFWEASYYCTPDDFSLLDADKNKGVSILLSRKYYLMPGVCYQFDSGVVKGFICDMTPDGAIVTFSYCEDIESLYRIVFGGFSIDEIKDMLGTITFDGSKSN